MLPRVGIAALIIDVARDVPFMDELRHAGGQQARSPTRRSQLFAALVACATGMGYTRMAEAFKFTERQLREAAERHCTIEHLAAADGLVCEAIREPRAEQHRRRRAPPSARTSVVCAKDAQICVQFSASH
jgi:hypothetical protein